MSTQKPILSICIPTFNRAKILKKTLENITSQEEFLTTQKVEIIISDNQSNDDTESVARIFVEKFPHKVRYSRNNENIRDANFEKVLSLGIGDFLKLHNDSLLVRPGTLTEIIKVIEACISEKPLLFFLNGKSKSNEALTVCNNTDEFLTHVSYNCTWIGGFGIWKTEFDQLNEFSRYSHLQLVQTDVLFRLLSNGKRAIVFNEFYFPLQDVGARGGYSLSKVFGENYLRILKENVEINALSSECFLDEKKKILLEHIIPFYFNEHHNFNKFGFFEHLKDYYNEAYFIDFVNQKFTQPSSIENSPQNKKASSIANLWRSMNTHNETYLFKDFNFTNVSVGNYTYGGLDVATFNDDNEALRIGNFVSIAEDVKFILGGNHSYEGFSTFPFLVKFLGHANEAWTKGPIIISDDVWIGYGTTILSGVSVGQGAVIAAKSVVTKNVPPYAIVAGNPARVIKYRFSKKVIDQLMQIDFSKLTPPLIQAISDELYTSLDDTNIDEIIKLLPLK
jgi:acetyltransferase-like isoleucine patch superfamily enzyme